MELDTIHHQLLVTQGHANHAMTSRIRERGLLPGQPKVLEYVADNEGCLQRDIAKACMMDRATVTGVLARMETAGLVERRAKKGDRRALEVRLTDAGWEAAEFVACCGAEVDRIAHAGMSAEERETLSRLLARVTENFEREERGGAHE